MKLTPWYPGSVKPVHVGWYEVKGHFCERHGIVSRFWGRDGWMWIDRSGQLTAAAVFDWDKWRGLAEKPKGAK